MTASERVEWQAWVDHERSVNDALRAAVTCLRYELLEALGRISELEEQAAK